MTGCNFLYFNLPFLWHFVILFFNFSFLLTHPLFVFSSYAFFFPFFLMFIWEFFLTGCNFLNFNLLLFLCHFVIFFFFFFQFLFPSKLFPLWFFFLCFLPSFLSFVCLKISVNWCSYVLNSLKGLISLSQTSWSVI